MNNKLPFAIGIVAVVVIGFFLVWAFSPSNPTVSANLTEITDKTSLQSQTELTHISIATGENYFGSKIRVVSGMVKNTSGKPLRLIQVKMTFTDYEGKPVQETVERAYENARKPLDPGAQHRFEVNFDKMPKNWNYRIPLVEVVKIGY